MYLRVLIQPDITLYVEFYGYIGLDEAIRREAENSNVRLPEGWVSNFRTEPMTSSAEFHRGQLAGLVLRRGNRDQGEGSGENWWFCRRMTDVQIQRFMDFNNISAHYSGPGRDFCGSASVQHTQFHTLIRQSYGLDI